MAEQIGEILIAAEQHRYTAEVLRKCADTIRAQAEEIERLKARDARLVADNPVPQEFAPHKTMTPEKYCFAKIKGPHWTRYNEDGTVDVRYCGFSPAPTQSTPKVAEMVGILKEDGEVDPLKVEPGKSKDWGLVCEIYEKHNALVDAFRSGAVG